MTRACARAQWLFLSFLSPQESFKGPLTLAELQNQELPHTPPAKAEEGLERRKTEKDKCTNSHARIQLSKQPKTKKSVAS